MIDREYWYCHHETLWRYCLERGIIKKKWKIQGLQIGKILTGEIKREELPDVTRQQILDSLLKELEKRGYVTIFEREIEKKLHESLLNDSLPRYNVFEDLSYERSGKCFKFFGTMHFLGEFRNGNQRIANFILALEPISGAKDFYGITISSIPVILDEKFMVTDIRVPQTHNWKDFYIVLVGSFTITPTPVIKAIAIYKESHEFEETFRQFFLDKFGGYCKDFYKEHGKIYDKLTEHAANFAAHELSDSGWKSKISTEKLLFTISDDLYTFHNILDCDLTKLGKPKNEAKREIQRSQEIGGPDPDLDLDISNLNLSKLFRFKGKMNDARLREYFDGAFKILGLDFRTALKIIEFMIEKTGEKIKILKSMLKS